MIRLDRDFGRRRRSGLTLIEVLVVVAIIGVLAGLIGAAVQAAREASRRLECENHLKQIGLALQQFQSAHGHYPPAMPGTSKFGGFRAINENSSHVFILPFIEQAALYNAINLSFPFGYDDRPENGTARAARIGVFLCPSESSPVLGGPSGPNSYRVNLGPSPYDWDPRAGMAGSFPGGGGGAFPFLYDIGPANFTDGLSHTAFLSEKLLGDGRDDRFTPNRDYWALSWPTFRYPPGDQLIALCQQVPPGVPPHLSFGGQTWYYGDFNATWYNHLVPPNWRGLSCKVAGSGPFPELTGIAGGMFGASGAHPGGVNCLLGDGSVRFINDSIDSRVWRALSTRAGGETIDSAAL